jgi:protein-tyrosine kinase
MSKIYEALLRAEQERREAQQNGSIAISDVPARNLLIADRETSDARTPEALTPAVLYADVLPARLIALDPEPTPVTPVPDGLAVGPATAPTTSAHLSLDLTQVRRTEWTPKFDKLPALETRGGLVEQFRSLRSRLFEFRDQKKITSILVSSGLPREGKSFTAINLAISFARHKAARVLLIDGDMRRGTLHEMLGCSHGVGLSTYLAGSASMTEVMQRPALPASGAALPPGLAKLTFIPAGAESDQAAELAGHPRFAQLIAAATSQFDWIIVDSSPVNLVSDGVTLARSCDAALLVARAGVTQFQTAQRALGELKAVNVLGVVLNAVKELPNQGGYYGYDSYDPPEAEAPKE